MKRRLTLLVLVFTWFQLETNLDAAAPFPYECEQICSEQSDCNTPCFETFIQFETENWSSCGAYDVCGYTSYCGDDNCDYLHPIYSEGTGSCPQDCPGACVPSYVYAYSPPVGGYFDENCIPVPSENAPDGSHGGAPIEYWCECDQKLLLIAYYHDENHCPDSTSGFSCVPSETVGQFTDYANNLGFCCESQPYNCWGSCPW